VNCLGISLDGLVKTKADTETRKILDRAGLRPTRQRMILANVLFIDEHRHVTAETVHQEVTRAGERVSLATIYNTLHKFKATGLLREISIDSQRTYYDTNTTNHNHYCMEPEGIPIDIPSNAVSVDGLPELPDGYRVSYIDVVVRLVRK
jgi:Fur family iron response transcriptional regulator